MKKNQTIETQLDCRATASLQDQIASDLLQADKSLASLLKKDTEEKDSEDDKTKSSD